MAKGNFIEYVISDDPNKYPNGGEQDGYYYRKVIQGGSNSGSYVWSKHESETGPIIEYVIGETEADYPDGGWKDGFWYTLKLGPTPPACLSFIGNEDFTLKTYDSSKHWNGTLEYSTNGSTWNTWDGTEISSVGSNLYLRGTGNTKITGNSNDYRFVFAGTSAFLKIACEGNIENLLDYTTVSAGGHPTMAENCYRSMFNGCTALTTAPELPATTLAAKCYINMFYECTSLTTAPALPATTLAENCYYSMFEGCTSLTTPPALPATTLNNYCYYSMFRDCTSLTTVPALPATTLDNNCYDSMFYGCTKIKLSTTQTGEYQTPYRIPKSGTGTAVSGGLYTMFYGTGGTFTGTPSINTTYYLSTSNTVV